MKHVASRENPLFKSLVRTARHAGRRGAQALLEGVHVCQAWLQHAGAPALAVFDAERWGRRAELAALARALPAGRIVLLEPRLLHSLESVEAGQGVLFVVDPPRPALPDRLDRTSVWLDRVQDPGNVGTLLRTCAAAGIGRVLLGEGCAAAWSPKVLRSGQGAHFALAVHEHVDLGQALRRLDVPLVVTAVDGAKPLYGTRLPAECAWVFGHEGQGVAPALQQAAALKVRIDHEPAVESLNVAVAAALCLFEQRRQRASAARPDGPCARHR